MRIEFPAGCHVDKAAQMLAAAAVEHGAAEGEFNGVTMLADGRMSAEEIVAKWTRDMDEKAVAYRNSPQGEAAQAESEARVTSLQEAHDLAMQDLRTLDWSSDVVVLDWICRIQDATDHVGVVVRARDIVDAFRQHGFEPGANCGEAFKADDRDNVHRYIVGQALDNLMSIGAIHGVIHKFAGNWKTRFAA